MFLGTHFPKLDQKGRFFLPAKFREELSEGLVITRQQDRCLAIYPKSVFEAEALQASKAPATIQKIRDYQRMLAAGATDEVPDKQGRLMIPAHLRKYASLDKELVVIGALNRVEIWDKSAWESYSSSREDIFAEMNEAVFLDQSTET